MASTDIPQDPPAETQEAPPEATAYHLAEEWAAYLRKRGVTPEIAAERGYRVVLQGKKEGGGDFAAAWGFPRKAAGLLIPLHGILNQEAVQLRLANPEELKGKDGPRPQISHTHRAKAHTGHVTQDARPPQQPRTAPHYLRRGYAGRRAGQLRHTCSRTNRRLELESGHGPARLREYRSQRQAPNPHRTRRRRAGEQGRQPSGDPPCQLATGKGRGRRARDGTPGQPRP